MTEFLYTTLQQNVFGKHPDSLAYFVGLKMVFAASEGCGEALEGLLPELTEYKNSSQQFTTYLGN